MACPTVDRSSVSHLLENSMGFWAFITCRIRNSKEKVGMPWEVLYGTAGKVGMVGRVKEQGSYRVGQKKNHPQGLHLPQKRLPAPFLNFFPRPLFRIFLPQRLYRIRSCYMHALTCAHVYTHLRRTLSHMSGARAPHMMPARTSSARLANFAVRG